VVRETTDRSGEARDRRQPPPAVDRVDLANRRRPTSQSARANTPDRRPARSEHVNRRSHVPPDDAYRVRQEAGLDVLIGMASQARFAVAEGATAIFPVIPAWPRERPDGDLAGRDRAIPGRPAGGQSLGRVRSLLAKVRADHLVRNSLWLVVSNALQAAIGFVFWIVMARLFSAQDVGLASSLISATTLLAFFALIGLNTTLMRYLPTARNRGALLTAAFVMVSCAAAVIATGYVMLTPIVAPRLDFVAHSLVRTAGFALLAAATAVNVLTDSVFLARRRADLCAVTDGIVGGLSKFGIAIILAGTGAYGLYLAALGGPATAAVISLLLIVTVLRWRPSFRSSLQAIKPLLKFSGANYVANSMNLLPNVVVPLIVLDRLGAKAAGYYFVAFQIANLLMTAAAVVEASFLAEASQAGADWRAIRRRSMRLAVILFVPAGVVTALAAHWILLAFGAAYSLHGTASLELLAVAVLPVAACSWGWNVLRVTGRLRRLIVSTAVYAASICGSAWFLAPHGLTAVSSAWLTGAALGAAVSSILARGGKAPARHRRGMGPGPRADLAHP
jgi:O-antigen/teichoic acid export membrane protein